MIDSPLLPARIYIYIKCFNREMWENEEHWLKDHARTLVHSTRVQSSRRIAPSLAENMLSYVHFHEHPYHNILMNVCVCSCDIFGFGEGIATTPNPYAFYSFTDQVHDFVSSQIYRCLKCACIFNTSKTLGSIRWMFDVALHCTVKARKKREKERQTDRETIKRRHSIWILLFHVEVNFFYPE